MHPLRVFLMFNSLDTHVGADINQSPVASISWGLCYATVKSFHQATMMESHSIAITESCNIKTCLCNCVCHLLVILPCTKRTIRLLNPAEPICRLLNSFQCWFKWKQLRACVHTASRSSIGNEMGLKRFGCITARK
jgi:hypothetical protein